jgi:hypothetical protein
MVSLTHHGKTLLEVALLLVVQFEIDSRVAVRTQIRPDAEACLVHLHGNEIPAREVMFELLPKTCTNALWFDNAETGEPWALDRIPVPMTTGECSVNPNRVLTNAGFESRVDYECGNDPVARKELRRFLDEVLLPKLSECRGELPVVAFHNNNIMTVLDLDTQKTFTLNKKSHDMLLVTHEAELERLSSLKRWNIALQSAPPGDDGSLSVLMQHGRYVNVEAHIHPRNKKNNYAMAEWSIRSVGAFVCGEGDWPSPARQAGAILRREQ